LVEDVRFVVVVAAVMPSVSSVSLAVLELTEVGLMTTSGDATMVICDVRVQMNIVPCFMHVCGPYQ
jgi:hypothetical protein